MRIAHVSATFPPYWGGTGNVCYYNARQLARRGHDVHVYTARLDGAPAEECLEGIQVHRLPPLFRFGNAPFLPGLLGLRGFDLVHLHHPFIFGAELIWLVSLLRRLPYVLTHHNDLIGTGHRRWMFDIYSWLAVPLVFSMARCLIPVSMDHATHSRLAGLFRRHSFVSEVPNGIDPQVFRPQDVFTRVRNSLDIPMDVPLCVFVAVLDRAHYYKGLDVLLQAIARPELSALHLLVIGDGDLKSHYQALSAEMKINSRVYVAGKIAHADLPQYLSSGDFLVLPSLIPESFGLVLVEALACGIPVIASDFPSLRTVVQDEVDGFLFKPGDVTALADKICRMLALPGSLRRLMGARGRQKVLHKYTWESAGEILELLYIKVLSV